MIGVGAGMVASIASTELDGLAADGGGSGTG
jgi:hypothetical protein